MPSSDQARLLNQLLPLGYPDASERSAAEAYFRRMVPPRHSQTAIVRRIVELSGTQAPMKPGPPISAGIGYTPGLVVLMGVTAVNACKGQADLDACVDRALEPGLPFK